MTSENNLLIGVAVASVLLSAVSLYITFKQSKAN